MSIKEHPPGILEYLLERVTLPDESESLLGDFAEVYSYTAQDSGRVYALSWYLYHLVKLVPTFISNTIEWSALMIKNYLKITFRTLRKHKGFTLINVVGLALSMAICLMIIIFIKDQKNSDRFHENKDRIGQLYMTDANLGWDVDGWANTPGTLAPYLLSNYPAIEDAVRLRKMGGNILHEGTAIYISGLYAEPSFLNIFSFPLRSGDPETALSEPYSIVLSEASAVRFSESTTRWDRRCRWRDSVNTR